MSVSSALPAERAAGASGAAAEAGQSLLALEVRAVVSSGISDLRLAE